MSLSPLYVPGTSVRYEDRHGREQVGTVLSIDGHWHGRRKPYLVYCVSHPTYLNGQFYVGEGALRAALPADRSEGGEG